MADVDGSVLAARLQEDASAERRFRATATTRLTSAANRLSPGTGVTDGLARLSARADRLAANDPRLAEVVDASRAATAEERQLTLERIIDSTSELQSSTFLARGARAAEAVARLSARSQGQEKPIGTAFLVTPTLLMTNHHVLPIKAVASSVVAEFRVELDVDNNPLLAVQVGLDAGRFFVTDPDLDVTVVSVRVDGPAPGETFGWAPLRSEEDGVVVGEALNIVGHPSGRLKEVAIRDNRLVETDQQFLRYTTDTERGSSGSPVFNNEWDVVALHHASIPQRDDQGRRLRKDGKVWTEGDGEDAVMWIANEGVRVSALLALLSGLALDPGPAALRDELVAAVSPHPTALVPRVREPVDGGGFEGLLAPAKEPADLGQVLAELDAALVRARRAVAAFGPAPPG